MSSLAHMDDDPSRGEFDPADSAQVTRLVRAATHFFGETLTLLPPRIRADILEEAEYGAIEVALAYDPATARTTKWKTAANRANTIVRKRLRELGREPLNETDVLEAIRRSHPGVTPDLTLVAADDDDDYDDSADELTEEEERMYEQMEREEEALRTEMGGDDTDDGVEVEPTEAELDPLVRAGDEDAEHFEMRRLLMHASSEPDRTILRRWTLSAPEVASLVGLTPDAVRQRKTRLRRKIDDELHCG